MLARSRNLSIGSGGKSTGRPTNSVSVAIPSATMGDRVQLNDEIHVAIGDGFATGNRPAQ